MRRRTEIYAVLNKTYRLTKRGSFTYVYNKGGRKSDKQLSLIFVPAKSLRIGFSVPNKVGKAVVRNRLKRRLRACCRLLLPSLLPAQMVIAARAGAETLTYRELCGAVQGMLARAKLLKATEK